MPQKRAQSSEKLEIRFLPIRLSPDFPIAGDWAAQRDAPIRHLHFHDCLELGFCAEGNGIFVIGDQILPFGRGSVVLISASQIHLARSAPGTQSRWAWIYLDPRALLPFAFANAELQTENFGHIFEAGEQPQISALAEKLARELENRAPDFEAMTRALCWQILLEAGRISGTNSPKTAPSRENYGRLSPALSRLANTHGVCPPIGELAALCGLSEAHFRRLFRATMNRSPREYAFDLQMRLAAALLRGTSQSVLSVAHDAGFASLSSFNRVFRKTFGVSPREWRRSGRAASK